MNLPLTRRQFLRSTGGITFLSLVPIGRGLFSAPFVKAAPMPVFTAVPYVQPGPNGHLRDGEEVVRLAWQTLHTPAEFEVCYGPDKFYSNTASVVRTQRLNHGRNEIEDRFNYVASLNNLELGREYFYRVTCNGELLAKGYFTTRQPRGRAIRFVSFGDNSFGDVSDRAIAYHAYQAHPDFVMNTGDNVYDGGLDNEYGRFFFPVYNADVAGLGMGGPLLRSVPFYSVIANHDVHAKDAKGRPVADFDASPDSLAYYTNFHLPLNGPQHPRHPTSIVGHAEVLDGFKACAGDRFPRMANYSFDSGDAHFLCLDSNLYVDPTDPDLQTWIRDDLRNTDALWKFVVYHHPPFNVGLEHSAEQHMRVLCPLFEEHGVDLVLHGHEHSYQRTVPLRFKPRGAGAAGDIDKKDRLVPGEFVLDQRFDGKSVTKPDGIIYVVTGAGGKRLYDPGFTNTPSRWLLAEDGNVPYVANFVSDRHSLTIFDLDAGSLTMRQVDEFGQEIDRIRVTKS